MFNDVLYILALIIFKFYVFSISGWDISSFNIAESMKRAKVLDYDLQKQLRPMLVNMKPRPSVYYPDFIANNQAERADNIISGNKQDHVDQIRKVCDAPFLFFNMTQCTEYGSTLPLCIS